jgi:hypothetical protein
MKHIVVILFAAVLAACQPAFINGVPNEASPYFTVPLDSKLVLRQALTVPAGEGSVYFQRGRVVRWSEVNVYGTYCSLKLSTKSSAPQTISPDELVVRRVSEERRFRLTRSSPRVQVAALGRIPVASIDTDDSGFTYEVLATVMQLQSARQSDVTEMACADWSTPQGITPISVRKIRQTLGDWFDLRLAPVSPP